MLEEDTETNKPEKQVKSMDKPTNLTFFLSRVPEYELETFHEKEFATSPPPALSTSSKVADLIIR